MISLYAFPPICDNIDYTRLGMSECRYKNKIQLNSIKEQQAFLIIH